MNSEPKVNTQTEMPVSAEQPNKSAQREQQQANDQARSAGQQNLAGQSQVAEQQVSGKQQVIGQQQAAERRQPVSEKPNAHQPKRKQQELDRQRAAQEYKAMPVHKGDLLRLTVEGIADSGEGVARYQGLTIFVAGALRGEEILAEISETKKTFARAQLRELYSASQYRCKPPCPVFDECGGCQLQHLKYGSQLREKQQQVSDALTRIGKLRNPRVSSVRGMAEPWHYRNKMHYQVVRGKGNKVKLGFYQENSHFFVDSNICLLAQPEINELAVMLQEMLERYNIQLYDWAQNKGYLRNVMIRRAAATGEMMLVLITGQESWNKEKELADDLLRRVPELKAVVRNFNSESDRVILGSRSRTLAGRDYIIDELAGIRVRIAAEAFYQINPQQTQLLYKQALDCAAITPQSVVVDAYCGIGTITLLAAQRAKQVYGIELSLQAIRSAQENLKLNKIRNVKFIAGRAELELAKLVADKGRPDVLIVDPPRKGCEGQLLQTIIEQEIERVVYVSCNPSTLARDAAVLVKGGYQLQEVIPVDMFGQTGHVETVVLMSKVR